MQIRCYNLLPAPQGFCNQLNEVRLAPRPSDGVARCGKCGAVIANYKGSDRVYRVVPVKPKRLRNVKDLF